MVDLHCNPHFCMIQALIVGILYVKVKVNMTVYIISF